ncbi:MAG: hypothetical protein CME06_09575 [Gemmatimonadetes bacterium]|nr:hypothetical protein [Gemmatimonadota bacterium]
MRRKEVRIGAAFLAFSILSIGTTLAASPAPIVYERVQSARPPMTICPMDSPIYMETSGKILCGEADGSILVFADRLPSLSRRQAYFGWVQAQEGEVKSLGRLTIRKGGKGFLSRQDALPSERPARVFVTVQRNKSSVSAPGPRVVLETTIE